LKTTRLTTQLDKESDNRATADRRVFERLPPQFESIDVRTNCGKTVQAKVANVSLGGICLRLTSDSGIVANSAVDLIYMYAVMPAVVRYVEAYDDGAIIAGLEWSKPPAV
jgi:hypothetical protein